jgi:hypothetical protein
MAVAGDNTQASDPSVILVDRLLRREPVSSASTAPTSAGAPATTVTTTTTTSAPGAAPVTDTATIAPVGAREDLATRAELGRMFTVAMRDGQLVPADRAYAARIVAARTGMSQADAEHRVDEIAAQAKVAGDEARAAADTARRAASYFSLWVFVSMLIGAFTASYAATLGGRRRDLVPV